jgi:hypothetical protein
MGTRAYLACTLFEELVEGHCYIVPIQHHLSMLEADDDVWDEVRASRRPTFDTICATGADPKTTEFHEVLNEDVCARGQGRRFLRDSS